MPSHHPAQSGEAGHQGRDRQPGQSPAASAADTPGHPAEAASPPQVHQRSAEANKPKSRPGGDALHPGPTRDEAEKSKGHLHHKQHEPQPDMQNEVEDL
jgi:hypothetical protein